MNSFEELWALILNTLEEKKTFSDSSFNLWLRDMELIEMTEDTVYIKVETDFKMNFIKSRYMDFISSVLCDILGFSSKIVLISEESADPDVRAVFEDYEKTKIQKDCLFLYVPKELREAEPQITREEPKKALDKEYEKDDFVPENARKPTQWIKEDPKLDRKEQSSDIEEIPTPGVGTYLGYSEKYTFENFIVGNTNRFAYNACKAVADDPSNLYNPLFIHGPSGLGKTHLLYAITNQLIISNPDSHVLYVKGEDFTNQLVDFITQKEPMHFFRDKYRNVDVLLVDDIQFIAGKTATQEEFFHTFNALHQENKQIIVTSDRPPRDMTTLEERLKSRFEWGLIVDMQPPDVELRTAILKKKCDEVNLPNVPIQILEYMAEHIKDNVRQLEGAIKKLSAYSFIDQLPIDMALARRCIKDVSSSDSEGGSQDTINRIFNAVCKKTSVSIEDIKSKKRIREIVKARHLAIFLLSKTVELPSTAIAKIFDQDHTSILYAINTLEKKAETDPVFMDEVKEIEDKVR